MVIKNPDGSIYTTTGTLTQFDPVSLEQDLFNVWDQEVMEIGGTPIYYFELFINNNDIDPLYVEARDKFWSQNAVCLYGYYDPVPSQNALGMFGLDSPDEIMIEFNYRSVLKVLGHPPKIGARLFTPHKQEHWSIIQRNVENFKLWGELRLQLMCERFQDSSTTGASKVSQPIVPFKLNSVKDLSNPGINLAGGQPLP